MTQIIIILKQAGAELCQAQTQVSFPAEAELNLTVEFQIWVLLEKTYTYRRHILIFNKTWLISNC
jgi:hypothetical protein